jgi:hypothetical protein
MLRETFRRYLQEGALPGAAAPLAAALTARGLTEEGELLARYAAFGAGRYPITGDATGTSLVHDVFVGPRPPAAAKAGDHWLDSCEVSLMILLPPYIEPDELEVMTEEAVQRMAAQLTWFSLRPVARWQFAAFLDVAAISRKEGRRSLLDAASILGPATAAGGEEEVEDVEEDQPVTQLSVRAASHYLGWFGKTFAGDQDFVAAEEHYGLSPWSGVPREWVGESAFNSDYAVAISALTFRTDPRETEDEHDPERRMLFAPTEAHPDITFRSALRMVHGLTEGELSPKGDESGTKLLSRFARPAG